MLRPQYETEALNGDVNGADVQMTGTDEIVEDISDDSDEDVVPIRRRTLRNADKREEERKRKEEEREAKEAAKKAKKKNPYEILKDKLAAVRDEIRDFEEEISMLQDRVQELERDRVIPLGKDRYSNVYYFYERNGMPIGGDPESSTADCDYMSGRLWVHGPDPAIHEGTMNLEEPILSKHKQVFKLTPAERYKRDYGETPLQPGQFGYFDTPEEVDKLLFFLDEKGFREKDLATQIRKYKPSIVECMKRMHAHIEKIEQKKRETEEESPEPISRISTRKRSIAEQDKDEPECLRWVNSKAVRDIGYKHSEQPVPKPRGGRGGQQKKKFKEDSIVIAPPPAASTRGRAKAAAAKEAKEVKKVSSPEPPVLTNKMTTRRGGRR
jgi:hypothetical protein